MIRGKNVKIRSSDVKISHMKFKSEMPEENMHTECDTKS
jgi:hypothetical protein